MKLDMGRVNRQPTAVGWRDFRVNARTKVASSVGLCHERRNPIILPSMIRLLKSPRRALTARY